MKEYVYLSNENDIECSLHNVIPSCYFVRNDFLTLCGILMFHHFMSPQCYSLFLNFLTLCFIFEEQLTSYDLQCIREKKKPQPKNRVRKGERAESSSKKNENFHVFFKKK